MRKLARFTLPLLAAGAFTVATTASSAAAIGYPPPCPVQPLIQTGDGTVSVHPGCLGQGDVAPVYVPLPAWTN